MISQILETLSFIKRQLIQSLRVFLGLRLLSLLLRFFHVFLCSFLVRFTKQRARV